MKPEVLRARIRSALHAAYGPRFRGVVLYGSEARGAAEPDSDIDLLILLQGPPEEPSDSWAAIDALYPLVLDSGRPIHAEPVDVRDYDAQAFPLYRGAKRDGVFL